MATVQLDITGFSAKMRQRALKRFHESVEAVKDEAVVQAPKKTGELASRIYTRYPSEDVGQVVSPAPYTIFVLYGTRMMAGNNFFARALVALRPYWGGSATASIHLAAVVSQRHDPGDYNRGMMPTRIPGNMPGRKANYKAIMIRKLNNAKYAHLLPDVPIHYYGSTADKRIRGIPKANRAFRAVRRNKQTVWLAQ